jgi:hypothetical protein
LRCPIAADGDQEGKKKEEILLLREEKGKAMKLSRCIGVPPTACPCLPPHGARGRPKQTKAAKGVKKAMERKTTRRRTGHWTRFYAGI